MLLPNDAPIFALALAKTTWRAEQSVVAA